MAEGDKDRPQVTQSSNSDKPISPLDIRSVSPLATPRKRSIPNLDAAAKGIFDSLAKPSDDKLSAETLSILAASAAAGKAAHDAAQRDLKGDLERAYDQHNPPVESPPVVATAQTEAMLRGLLPEAVVFVFCEAIGVPFCHAGADAFVNGHYGNSVVGFGLGLPLVVAGLTFHWWKEKVGGRWVLRAANRWWPVALLAAFVYVAGPVIYRRATETVAAFPIDKSNHPTAAAAPVLCWDGPCAPTHKKPGPEYLKEIGLGSSPGQPLMLQATPAATSERLRVFVDYSEYRNGWMPKTRAFIGEIKEPVKGKIER